tara:strand:+ start:71 stop:301 length:231 start_codon:yes stop_codon:yes gene_type:complete
MTTKATELSLPKYFKRSEVAEMLAIDEQTIDVMRKSGRIGSFKLSRQTVRFSTDHLADYFESIGDFKNAERVREHV